MTSHSQYATVQLDMSQTVNSSRLTGRVAVITGAGQGIGRAVGERFTAEGAAIDRMVADTVSLPKSPPPPRFSAATRPVISLAMCCPWTGTLVNAWNIYRHERVR